MMYIYVNDSNSYILHDIVARYHLGTIVYYMLKTNISVNCLAAVNVKGEIAPIQYGGFIFSICQLQRRDR